MNMFNVDVSRMAAPNTLETMSWDYRTGLPSEETLLFTQKSYIYFKTLLCGWWHRK